MASKKEQNFVKGAITTGVINAFINGGIQYFFLKDMKVIPISVDAISNDVPTVLGEAVSLAISLSILLTVVAYFTIKEEKVKFFPTVFWLVIKHGFFTFGVVTSLAVLWQKNMGTINVSLLTALLIIGAIAGLVSAVINYLTLKECTLKSKTNE